MIDRAALFTALTHRNVKRRAAGLPLLNLREELAHDVALAVEREVQTLMPLHADEHDRIARRVEAELVAREGAAYANSMAGCYTIRMETRRRYTRFLHRLIGVEGTMATVRHPVPYGAPAAK